MSLKSASRGFLFGDIYHGKVANGYRRSQNGEYVPAFATVVCQIDVTRLVMELMVVISAATTLTLFFTRRSGQQPENTDLDWTNCFFRNLGFH